MSKGLVAKKILSVLINDGKMPGFVLCIGDDRSDEDMFESLSDVASSSSLAAAAPPPEVFACTVGQKPSRARYYLDNTTEVMTLLRSLASASGSKPQNRSDNIKHQSSAFFTV